MVITVTLNPAVDKTVFVPGFSVNAVNRVEQIILDPGGKGINVSKSVQALGGKTVCLGILGGSTGSYIRSALDQMNVPHNMTESDSATRTNTKIVDLKLGTNTDVNEPGAAITQEQLEDVWNKLVCAAEAGDTVVFAGKNPPGTPEDLLALWTKELRKKNIRVGLDTVGIPMKLALREKPDIIKPNLEELALLIGKEPTGDAQVLDAARELTMDGVGLVAVSMGGDGAMFVTKDRAVRTRCPKVKVVSTVGAEDSMMAALVYYAEMGLSLEELSCRATAVATATVQVSGSQPAELSLVNEILPLVSVETL